MRLQTSIEFLMVLSAIAGLCVFVLAGYSSVQKAQASAYSKISEYSSANTPAPPLLPGGEIGLQVYHSFANVTYVNRSNELDVIVSYPTGYALDSVYIQDANAVVAMPDSYVEQNCSGVTVLPFQVIPSSPGRYNVTVYWAITAGNVTIHGSAEIGSYAVYAGQPPPVVEVNGTTGGFSAYLSQRNESVIYPAEAMEPVDTFSTWTRCALHSFWGNRFPSNVQCGSPSWGYASYNPDCNPYWYNGQDQYNCFYPHITGYNGSYLSQSPVEEYNALLVVYNNTTYLHAWISSASQNSPLMNESGYVVGNVTVTDAYVQGALSQPYQFYALVSGQSGPEAVNISTYTNYYNTDSDFVGALETYNNSEPSADTITVIDDEMQALNDDASALISVSPSVNSNCSVISYSGTYAYGCRPSVPLAYDVIVNVPGVAGNHTASYDGSTITVR